MLNPPPSEKMVDRQQRPYFLWDCDLDIDQFRRRLRNPNLEIRAYFIGKLMRQAKPDDVFEFVSAKTIRELWPRLERFLGEKRPFWEWLFSAWETQGRVWR
jgi:hypothetical protein